jgi:Tfp pilus assembly protein PilF
LGDSLARQGRVDAAERAYRETTQLNPQDWHAHLTLGDLLAKQGRLEEAERTYRQAIQINPRNADHTRLSLLLEAQGRLEDAEKVYRKVGDHTRLGFLLEAQGRLEEAERAYRQATQINPLNAHAPFRLGVLLAEQGRLEEARVALDQVRDANAKLGQIPRAKGPGPTEEQCLVFTLAGILASGNLPKQAMHRAVNDLRKPERSPVDCTVFAPDRVERERTRLLQVFLHAPEARKEAERAANHFDPEATERGHRSLVLDAPIGTIFAFDVEIEGFVIRERTDTLLWTGKPQAATFQFAVPKGCELGQHAGTVRISQDGAPVGRIAFQIEVVCDARDASQEPRPVGKQARHYHACFCSYSSLDRAEMLKRAQGIRATGLETFIDVLALRPGDMWNPKIFEAIDESDLFVVIWSTNARDSEWVKKESQYALRHYMEHGSPDFVPIPVEGPPIASVPQDLQAYHFNDELLGQIRAAELEMLARKKEKT